MNPSTKHDRSGGTKSSSPAPTSVQADQQPGPTIQPSVEERSLPAAQQRPPAQTQSAADLASSLASDMKESARTASRAVKEQASEFASHLGHELSETAEEQKAHGVEAIHSFARAMSSAG
jgi:hypothetical protein